MRKPILTFSLFVILLICVPEICLAQQEPVLFFSDLDWGPKTGWEGSPTRGAAVTIWGENLGAVRGSSYVTVNGVDLTSDTDYAEWGEDLGPARGLDRITFWLNNNCQDDAGEIAVTVDGVTSNALDFTVMDGEIYFISVNDGDNSNNGQYSTDQGGGNGPWRDIYMFNPGLAGHSYGQNPSGDGQYIVYVREGAYTALDVDSAFVALRGPYGGPDKRKALVGYPGETPVLDVSGASRGVIWNANYDPYGRNSYFTYSKLHVVNGTDAISSWGNYNRVIGCHFKDMLDMVWSGVVMVDNSEYTRVYGTYFEHLGYDSYKHNIYVKTHRDYIAGDKTCQYTYLGWNEFYNAYANDGHGGVIFLSTQSYAGQDGKFTNNVYIHDNYFHDGNMEFIYCGDNVDVNDVYIYNNVFEHGTCDRGIFLAWGTKNIYLYNNIFYQIGDSGGQMIRITDEAEAVFKNNIWHSRSGQTFMYIETYHGAIFNSDHDLYYDPDGSTSPPSGSGITTTNPVTGDPLFVNPESHDFHIQPTSPCIDNGTADVASIVFEDFDKNPRPMDGDDSGTAEYDIGAYEYTGAYIPPQCPDDDIDGHSSSTCGGTDCDDTNATIYPGAPEICGDGIDQDCDGGDLACPDCGDNDGDGYFNVSGCGTSVDCDDDNPDVNQTISCTYDGSSCGTHNLCLFSCPVPPPEICINSQDDDCDVQEDCDDSDCSVHPSCLQAIPGICNNLTILYHLDNQAEYGENPSLVYDFSGNGNNGTVTGATFNSSGKFSGAYGFDGMDDYIEASDVGDYLDMTRGTIQLWYKADGAGTDAELYSFMDSGDLLSLYFVTVHTLRLLHRSDYENYNSIDVEVPPITTDTEWRHVVASWDVNGADWTLSLTFDGAQSTYTGTISVPVSYSGAAYIGSDFSGIIDEVAIWSRVLSADDASELYSADSSISCETHHRADSDQDGCITMDELTAFIELWIQNSTEYPMWEMMQAVVLWKSGEGCS